MGDPVQDYLNQILNEDPNAGGASDQQGPGLTPDTGLSGPTVTPVGSQAAGSNTTLQALLRANGTVTGITPLPQSQSQQLSQLMGTAGAESILRYTFANGKQADVGAETSDIYRGSALSTLASKTGQPIVRNVRGRLLQYDPTSNSWAPAQGAGDPNADLTRRLLSAQAANAEWAQEHQRIALALEERRISLEQAKAMATEAYDRITAQQRQKAEDVTQRGQDIQARGQDVTQRGQDLDMATQLANEGSRGMSAALPFMAPKGTSEDISNLVNSFATGKLATVQPRSAPFPYDPSSLPMQIALQALAKVSPLAAKIAAPPAQVNTAVQLPPPVFSQAGP